MTAVRVTLASLVVAAGAAIACSETTGEAPAAVDAGADASLPPPPPPPAEDAGGQDAARAEIEPASRLPVTCAKEPCYVALSGNGGEHFCGLLSDGTVRCWGRDTKPSAEPPPDGGEVIADGALGRGHAVTPVEGASPAPVVDLRDVTQISVNRNLGTCALTEDGAVYCWGRNEFGQLGHPASTAQLPVPARVEGIPAASSVALGPQTGCAIAREDGALYCWGANKTTLAIAADAGTSAEFPPQRFATFGMSIKEVSIGTCSNSSVLYAETIVTRRDGWFLGTLGADPVIEPSPYAPRTPFPVEIPGVTRAFAFAYLTRDALLLQWMPSRRALYIPFPEYVVDVAIACGREARPFGANLVEQAGVLLSSGRLFRWGRNTAGTLGYPPSDLDIATEPIDMTHVAGSRVASFATTQGSTCISDDKGEVRCWGSNERGELGRGTIDADNHPFAEVIR